MLVLSTGNVAVLICGWSVMSIGCRSTHRTEDSKTQTGHCQVFLPTVSHFTTETLFGYFSPWLGCFPRQLYKMKIFKFKKPWHLKDPWYFFGGLPPSQETCGKKNYSSLSNLWKQVIPGASDKLMIFFQGGGACFNDVSTRQAASCLALLGWCTAWLLLVIYVYLIFYMYIQT